MTRVAAGLEMELAKCNVGAGERTVAGVNATTTIVAMYGGYVITVNFPVKRPLIGGIAAAAAVAAGSAILFVRRRRVSATKKQRRRKTARRKR
jgi:phosphatidylserine synthase